jgi:hypothetical protein
MNFSEFKTKLGTEPRNRDPEMLQALDSGEEFRQAADEADRFETKLENALLVAAPENLLDDILAIPGQPPIAQPQSPKRSRWMPFAVAASLLVAIAAAGTAWKQSRQWDSVEAYLAEHYQKDGAALLQRASNGIDAGEIQKVMAALNAETGEALANRISFIKFCPTPGGRGAHMVVDTEQGPVTVIFMPTTRVKDHEMVEFGDMHALLVALPSGSAAIIGGMDQPLAALDSVVRNSIQSSI